MLHPIRVACCLVLLSALGCSKASGAPQPRVTNGILDLRAYDFESRGPTSMSGLWRFYPGRLLSPEQAQTPSEHFLKVPGSWAKHKAGGVELGTQGAATYGLTILLPKGNPQLMLYQRQIDTAGRIFANGQLIGSSGVPGPTADTTKSKVSVQTLLLPRPADGKLELAYQVANFSNDIAGIWEAVDIGRPADISARREGKLLIDYFLFGAFVLAGIYHMGLFISRRRDVPALLFGLFCLVMALRIPVTGETTIHRFISALSYHNYKQLDHILVYLGAPLFTGFLVTLFSDRFRRALIIFACVSSAPFILCVLLLDVRSFVGLLAYYELVLVSNILLLIAILVVAVAKKREGAAVSLAGLLVLFATIVNDILASQLIINAPYYLPFGLFVFIFSQAYMLSRLFARAYNTAETLSIELQQKNNDLLRLDQIKDEFMANTSHELRTPLNGIIGIADSLLAGAAGAPSEGMRKNLKLISYSGRRLSSLVNDVLDFSRLRNEDLQLRRRPVDVSSAVDVVLLVSQALLGEKNVRLINRTPGLMAYADEDRLDQVLHNLIGNAIKFTAAGEISVSGRLINQEAGAHPMIEICVEDTGIGVAEEHLETIFNSFTQADGSISREYGGTGLGLSISKSLVELHGGTIRAEKRPEGGSRFYFTLPAADSVEANATEESPEVIARVLPDLPPSSSGAFARAGSEHGTSTPGAKPAATASIAAAAQRSKNGTARILVVDDDPVNLQVLHNHLSVSDYAVESCGSGREALALLEGPEAYDLILLDVMMPRLSGYEVCRIVRDSFSATELPVIMLTAKNRVSDLVTGFDSGANDYLVKPFDARELLARVRTMLDLKAAAHSQSHLAALQSEIQVAHKIQESLLPKKIPQTQGLQVAARYRAMTGLGGDFYDLCPTGPGQLGALVADVSGHGVPAALIVSMLKVAFWFHQRDFAQPALLLDNLNRSLFGNTRTEFVTACFVWIDLNKGTLVTASAGHPPLYVWRRRDRKLHALRPFGKMLAVFPEAEMQAAEMAIVPGDRILLYTDGIPEATNGQLELLGQERIEEFLRESDGLTSDQFADGLLNTAVEWSGGPEKLSDDLSLVVIDVDDFAT